MGGMFRFSMYVYSRFPLYVIFNQRGVRKMFSVSFHIFSQLDSLSIWTGEAIECCKRHCPTRGSVPVILIVEYESFAVRFCSVPLVLEMIIF